jgi:hypothetical protein
MIRVEGAIITRSDGVRLLLQPYRQVLSGGEGAGRRQKVQVQAYSRETGLAYGCVRATRAGEHEVLLGSEANVFPLGETVYDHLGAPERLFFVEPLPDAARFVIVAAAERKVVLDTVVELAELQDHYGMLLQKFGEAEFTLAATSDVLPNLMLPSNAKLLEGAGSSVDTAAIQSNLRFVAIEELSGGPRLSGGARKLGVAAGIVAVLVGAYFWKVASDQKRLEGEATAKLAKMKTRTLDPLAEYKNAMRDPSAAERLESLSALIRAAASARGWVPSRLVFTPGEPLKVSMASFGGRRTDLVKRLRIPGARFAQESDGVALLAAPNIATARLAAPPLEPLSKVLFETLDALDATGFAVAQTGEVASFGGWSIRKVQINFDTAPLMALDVVAATLAGRPVNLSQATLTLDGQRLTGIVQLDVYGS